MHFRKYFFKINKIIMHVHFQNISKWPVNNGTSVVLKYFKCIEPSKEEGIQSVLPKPCMQMVLWHV